jgi:acetolactate synthase-1/3 small subunit|tara:strand:+ start:543 stop:1034 length:492 start_codon:yes stop_codon:yes gene_type:complete
MKHIISIIVKNEPGVMTKISGMFARRGFNIDTITVGKTHKSDLSKIVITVIGHGAEVEQIEKQLNKMIDVIKVIKLPYDRSVIRELCLVKISAPDQKKHDQIVKYANVYKNKIVDITSKIITLEIIGEPQKITTFLELVKPFGIKDISRTGATGILRDKVNEN